MRNNRTWSLILLYLSALFLLFPFLSHAFTATYVDPAYTASNFHTLSFVSRSLEFDQSGSMYVVDVATDNSGIATILRLDAYSNFTTSSVYVSYPMAAEYINGLHFDSGGNLFVSYRAYSGDSGHIDRLDASSLVPIVHFVIPDPLPTGLSGDASGALYVAGRRQSDPNFGNVYKIDSAGIFMNAIIGGVVGKGIAVDNSGNIFVSNMADNSIYKYDALTLTPALIATFDTTPGELTFDNNGNLYAMGENATLTESEIIKLSLDPVSAGVSLTNISTRGSVQTGDNVMIGGFIISGTAPRSVLIRGFGPTLADFGVTGAMSNPYIELYSGQTMIATNDNWQTPITQCDAPVVSCGTPQDIQATGKDACTVATTGCNQDAAILVTLPPGAYTAILRGVGGGTGVGLVGIDDNDTGTLSKLVNISTRGPVLTGDSVMIGGFIVGGSTSKTVLIRGFGPTLTDFGVPGALANPYVELYSGQTMIATNDNWQTPIAQCDAPAILCGTPQDIQTTGKDACSVATTGCSQDAAILVTLPPGAYTAIVRGVGGGTGVGLVGIDEIVP